MHIRSMKQIVRLNDSFTLIFCVTVMPVSDPGCISLFVLGPQGSRALETRHGHGKSKDNDGDIGDSAPHQNDSTTEPPVTTPAQSLAASPVIKILTADLRTAVLKVPNPVYYAYLRRPL